ncbi:MAG: GNAT family N-acetyltransferase [Ignavibacteria bacterium]
MKIQLAVTESDIIKCKDVIKELRINVDPEKLVSLIKEMLDEGYQLAFIELDGKAVSAIGYRYMQFLHNGKHFYIDDLSTLPEYRGKGYAGKLIDYVADLAEKKGFGVITLDSGPSRHDAHRLYLNKGFIISSYHFSKKLKST